MFVYTGIQIAQSEQHIHWIRWTCTNVFIYWMESHNANTFSVQYYDVKKLITTRQTVRRIQDERKKEKQPAIRLDSTHTQKTTFDGSAQKTCSKQKKKCVTIAVWLIKIRVRKGTIYDVLYGHMIRWPQWFEFLCAKIRRERKKEREKNETIKYQIKRKHGRRLLQIELEACRHFDSKKSLWTKREVASQLKTSRKSMPRSNRTLHMVLLLLSFSLFDNEFNREIIQLFLLSNEPHNNWPLVIATENHVIIPGNVANFQYIQLSKLHNEALMRPSRTVIYFIHLCVFLFVAVGCRRCRCC